jgi:glycosyltransferase involved in cell wall biosynthesis
MHDNFPQREHLTKRIFVKLANRDAKCAWSLLHPEVIRALCSWASENAMLREEIEVLSTYDRVLFYSAEEADTFIKAGLPSAQVSTLPWACVTKNNLSSAINLHTSHFDVGIIASSAIFNVEGIEYFAREIMPMLAKNGLRPSVLVAGSIGKYARHFFCADDSVEFIDWVEDVSTFYSRVNTVAVPLLSGTGISIKTLEAASYGAPIVSTSVGIRGVSIRPGIDLLLGDSAEDFAGALAKLLADDTLRARLGRSVRDRIKSTHSPSELLRRIRAIV